MKYLGIGFIILNIIVIAYLFHYMKKVDNLNQNVKNKIRYSKLVFYVSVFALILTNIVLPVVFLRMFELVPWHIGVLYVGFLMVCLNPLWAFFLLLYFNWGIYVEDECIVYYNLFKKKKIYNFARIFLIKSRNNLKIVRKYVNRRKKIAYKTYINISIFCQNLDFLVDKYYAYENLRAEQYWATHPQNDPSTEII